LAVLKQAKGKAKDQSAIEDWIAKSCPQAVPVQALINSLRQKGSLDLAMMTVIEQQLRKLI